MGKYSSPSQKRKLLLFTSFAVSLALHAGGLYFLLKHPFSFISSANLEKANQALVQDLETDLEIESALSETLSRLIITNESSRSSTFDRPRLEKTEKNFQILTNYSSAPDIPNKPSPSLHFQLASPTFFIKEQEEYATPKKVPLTLKKWIDFSQSLDLEIEPFAEIKEEKKDFYVLSKLEEQEQLTHLKEVDQLPLEIFQTPLESPFAFDLPAEPLFEIITQDPIIKKHETEKATKIKKSPLLTSLAKAVSIETHKKLFSFEPSHEKRAKGGFDRETLYFFYDSASKKTELPALNTKEVRLGKLYSQTFTPPKQALLAKTLIGGNFFSAIAPLDLSSLSDTHKDFPHHPYRESVKKLVLSSAKQLPEFFLPRLKTPKCKFKSTTSDPLAPLIDHTFQRPTPLRAQSLGRTLPSHLPQLSAEIARLPSQSKSLCPKKESAANLALSADSLQTLKERLQLPLETQNAIAFSSYNSSAQPLISGAFDFPCKKPQLTLSNWDALQIRRSDFILDTKHKNSLATVLPKKEDIKHSFFKRPLELDLIDINSENQAFKNMDETKDLPLSLPRKILPRQQIAKASSYLTLQPYLPKNQTSVQAKAPPSFFFPRKETLTVALSAKSLEMLYHPRLPRYLFESHFDENLAFSFENPKVFLPYSSTTPHALATLSQEKSKIPLVLAAPHLIKKAADVATGDLLCHQPSDTLTRDFELKPTASSKKRQLKEAATLRAQSQQNKFELFPVTSSKIFPFEFEEEQVAIMNSQAEPIRKKIQPQQRLMMPKLPSLTQKKVQDKVSKDLPSFKVSPTQIDRLELYPFTKKLTSKSPAPLEQDELYVIIPEKVRLKLTAPPYTPCADFMFDTLEEEFLSIKAKNFEHLKVPRGMHEHLTLPALPNLMKKNALSNKALIKPQQALDFSEVETLFSLASRAELYPFTKSLIGKTPVPQREAFEPAIEFKLTTPPYDPCTDPLFNSFELAEELLSIKAKNFEHLKMPRGMHEHLTLPTLPNLMKKNALSNKALIKPQQALDFSEVETLFSLASRAELYPFTKSLIGKTPVPQREASEPAIELKLTIPPYDPCADFMFDTLEEELLALKAKNFEHLKVPRGMHEHLTLPALPNLMKKNTLSNKALIKPQQALDFSEIETLFSLASKAELYPFTKSLIGKTPAPQREASEPTAEVRAPETADIKSQAKELLEKHYEETLAQKNSPAISIPELAKRLNEKDVRTLNETHRSTQTCLAEIPALANLATISFNNEFETVVTYVPKSDNKGYHFAVKIKPSDKLYFASPEQNLIFIVDGSSSIKKHRYNTFKDAVVKSLSYMQEGDSFNIIVADSQIASMSKEPIIWSKNAIKKARNYLQSRSYRGFFSNYNAFYLLSKATNYFVPTKENSVIFITDGHSLDNIKKHKEEFKQLAELNKGRFSLFTACASKNNNLTMLDLISTFNNGEFMYSQTNVAFPRKLAILVKHIESCIAKDIRIHVTSLNNQVDIQFYPNQEAYPSLFADRPYTLYGSIDNLEDFDLILQGRSGDQWLNIKQRISFKKAELAGYTLKRNFAQQQAYVCYDYYLKKDDPFFLAEAERILYPHAIKPATR